MTEFVDQLRGFLAEHHPGPPPRDGVERLAWQRAWAAHLVDEGWAGPSWPLRYGGMDLDLAKQVAYHQEFAAAGVPRHPSPTIGTVGPTIILHGSDDQRDRFLRPMLRADDLWAQGFSEPDAGSDLLSLTTTAERDGDDYLVTGQKVWSSDADRADWLFALVRTSGDPGSADGITYLLVDLSSDGVDVRPIRDMTGARGFCEVFLDGVRVPAGNRVGTEGGGWRIARTSLGHERSAAAVARAHAYRHTVDQLIALARVRGRAADPVVRQRLAEVEIGVRVLGLNAVRVLDIVAGGGEPGPASSASRLFHALFEQRLHETAVDLIGADSLLGASDDRAIERGRWTWGFLRTRASTIGAGTAEIQRNTLAERVLGLPRDP